MAEEQAAPAAPEEEGEALQIGPAEEQPQKSKKTPVIIVASLVLLIMMITTTVLFLLFSGEDELGVTGTEEEAEFVEQYNQRMQTELKPPKQLLFTDPFDYNVNMKNGMNYVHLRFRAELTDPNAVAFLHSRTPLIDDIVISILKQKMPQDLKKRTGLELLKQEIYIELNKLFPEEFIEQSISKDRMPVKAIRISEYFIQ